MLRFVVRRVLVAVPLLVAASILSFALTTAMGDPLCEWKAERPRTEQEIATQYARIGYDQPPVVPATAPAPRSTRSRPRCTAARSASCAHR